MCANAMASEAFYENMMTTPFRVNACECLAYSVHIKVSIDQPSSVLEPYHMTKDY